MRLVSLAQAGQPVTRDHFMSSLNGAPVPLPRFALPQTQWSIGAEDQSKYSSIFSSSASPDGFVGGRDAVQLLGKSGLDKPVLKHIWTLSDRDADGKLNVGEFSVAMHLVVCASKRGMPPPATLPIELVQVGIWGMGAHAWKGGGSVVGFHP